MTFNRTVIISPWCGRVNEKRAKRRNIAARELLRGAESFAEVRPSESECIQIMIANAARLMRIVISAAEATRWRRRRHYQAKLGCLTNKNSDVTAILASVCALRRGAAQYMGPSSENQKRVHCKAESVSQCIYTVSLFTYDRLN
jgi:hypothetical protein